MSLRSEKETLRERMSALRDEIAPADREERAARVAQRLLRAADGLGLTMVFLSFGSELPTAPICERLVDAGHALAVPHIAGGELVPVAFEPGEPMTEVVWGIREPATLRPLEPTAIDVVAVPGLAFDREGYRVGYGGGFYDRLLRRCRTDTVRAGVGFHLQVVPNVPHGDGDERLRLVLTERETIACGGLPPGTPPR